MLHNLNSNSVKNYFINIENTNKKITIFDKNKIEIASTKKHDELKQYKSYSLNAKYKKKKYSFKINIG